LQGEYNVVPVEEICTDNKIVGLSGSESVCSVCGCEDNEKFEIMVSVAPYILGSDKASQVAIVHSSFYSRLLHLLHVISRFDFSVLATNIDKYGCRFILAAATKVQFFPIPPVFLHP
jgi:hypothetical protein